MKEIKSTKRSVCLFFLYISARFHQRTPFGNKGGTKYTRPRAQNSTHAAYTGAVECIKLFGTLHCMRFVSRDGDGKRRRRE